jgi:hypothetical protein
MWSVLALLISYWGIILAYIVCNNVSCVDFDDRAADVPQMSAFRSFAWAFHMEHMTCGQRMKRRKGPFNDDLNAKLRSVQN